MAGLTPNSVAPKLRHFLPPLPGPLAIGALAAVVIIIAVGLRIGVAIYHQHAAIREVERVGGQFDTEPREPQWLRQFVGEERMEQFDAVVYVDLEGSDATDATLNYIASLPDLEYLSLSDTRVSDWGLSRLSELTRLQWLDLDGTQVTDRGLASLKSLRALRSLRLRSTQVSGAGLPQLVGLAGLQELYLDDTAEADAGVADLLRAMPDLKINPPIPMCGLGSFAPESE
jgi:hypothetical protein